MPKLNATHLPERLKEAIKQLEDGKEVEAKKNKTLLNAEQKQELDDAWAKQQELRKHHKPPKTEQEKKKIGWKDKPEVRIEIYKKALAELEEDIFDIHLKQLAKEQAKATKAYLKGYFGAGEYTVTSVRHIWAFLGFAHAEMGEDTRCLFCRYQPGRGRFKVTECEVSIW